MYQSWNTSSLCSSVVCAAVVGVVKDQLCWASSKVFSLLHYLSCAWPRLVQQPQLLEAVARTVAQAEASRGQGRDVRLRWVRG